ncbi:DUF2306 domain-containing protein [Streptomyces sp. SID8382]|uniref:DUF2306 domain-containing protein n=1 Tax=Streptomyces malaysiensis TaxID=92644 RepID=UPI000C2C7FA0|nr:MULTISPECIES: DUF2306 domain-containing protein [unclassified Streptomyces]AUA16694.1 hypothetical protein CFP59_08885 [Streptomyces sp. M56]MYX63269.1 DUF2306 domain-containing protein [Streptomyces sp. SID8382]
MADTLTPESAPASKRPIRSAPRRRRWPWTFIALTSVAVAGWFSGQYVEGLAAVAARTPDNVTAASHFDSLAWPVRILFIVHITFGGVALAIGPFQFSKRLRGRGIRSHRIVGRVYVTAVLTSAVTGATTSLWNSLGIRGVFGYFTLDVLWAWTAWLAYRAARERRIREHQAWMIRNFALTYAAVTLRAALPVLILLQLPFHPHESFARLFDNSIHTIAPWLGWLINIVIAEWLIARRGLPGVRWETFQEDHEKRPARRETHMGNAAASGRTPC